MTLHLRWLASTLAAGCILLCGIVSINNAAGQAAAPTGAASTAQSNTLSGSVPSFNAANAGFGASLAAVHLTSQNIGNATIQDGKVLVTSSNNTNVGFGIETHLFFNTGWEPIFSGFSGPGRVGIGPFVGAQLGTNGNALSLLGFGPMIGLQPDPTKNWSMNLGIGIGYAQINHLGNGLSNGSVVPSGFGSNITQTRWVPSPFIMFSFSYYPFGQPQQPQSGNPTTTNPPAPPKGT
jgi:hypothetical protein